METNDKAVAIARDWIGTPYRHQGTRRGAGCDCLGLIRGIWRDMYGHEPEAVPAYSADWAEPQGAELLMAAALRHLVIASTKDIEVGDVLLFRMRDGVIAKHLGIQSDIGARPRFIHAYQRHGVLESPLSEPWQRRIAARFRFPKE